MGGVTVTVTDTVTVTVFFFATKSKNILWQKKETANRIETDTDTVTDSKTF